MSGLEIVHRLLSVVGTKVNGNRILQLGPHGKFYHREVRDDDSVEHIYSNREVGLTVVVDSNGIGQIATYCPRPYQFGFTRELGFAENEGVAVQNVFRAEFGIPQRFSGEVLDLTEGYLGAWDFFVIDGKSMYVEYKYGSGELKQVTIYV